MSQLSLEDIAQKMRKIDIAQLERAAAESAT